MRDESRSFRPVFALSAAWSAAFLSLASGAASARDAGAQGMVVLPKLAYIGNPGCTGAKCHSADAATEQSGQMIGDELTIWDTKDPHAKAFKTLADAKSKEIAGKLKVADAATDARCLSCHSMASVPDAQRKPDKFKHTVGVGCESCHGPAEKYLEPHKQAGWYASQRKTLDAKGMADTWGVIDTHRIDTRAATCVSCHLQIDKDMLDAGHPALRFEMYGYNYYAFDPSDAHQPHWEDPRGEMIDARMWAVGQAAALDAARRQVAAWKAKGWATADAEALEAMYAAGVAVAKKAFGADTAAGLQAATLDGAKCAAAAKDLAASAPVAKSQLHRKVIASGVAALVTASFDSRKEEAPEAFWAAYDVAIKGDEGAGYADAVKKMAEQAK